MAQELGFEPRRRYYRPNGFQDRPLKPLGYSCIWWSHLELNQGHKDLQSFALPTELQNHYGVYDGIRTRIASLEDWNPNLWTTYTYGQSYQLRSGSSKATTCYAAITKDYIWRRFQDLNLDISI